MTYKYDLFISYSSKNRDVADYLVNKIEERRYKCFIDHRDINLASEYPVELTDGITNSIAVLLIFSHDADVSRHVLSEVNFAFSNNKTIIPFKIEDIQPSKKFLYFLGLPQWLDAFPKILDFHLEEVIKKLKALKDVETLENQEKTFKIIGPQLLNSEDISKLGIDYKFLLMKKNEIDYICIPTLATEKDSEKNSEELHNLRPNIEVENSVLLIKNDEIIGYCDLCPVTKDAYNELVTGKSLLQENMVDVYFSGDTIDICIPMLAILPTHKKTDNYGLIFEWIFQKFLSWYEDEITVNRICISVYSSMLDKIVRKFGFIEKSLNPIKGKIYSTSLAELKENKSVGKGKKYKKFFESIIISEETKISIDNNANSKASEEKNSTIKTFEKNKTASEKGVESKLIIETPVEKKSVSVPPTTVTPKSKFDAPSQITIAPPKIITENISSVNQSPLATTENVQTNEPSASVKHSPTIKSESDNVHYDLFISYSVRNINTVNRIVEKIEKRGYKCFIAPRNTISLDYKNEINSEIIHSTAILLIFSFFSDTSNFVFNELDVAVSKNKSIIPIKIENITPSKTIQLRLKNVQWIEAISGIQDVHINKIIEQLEIAKKTNSTPKVSSDSSTSKRLKETGTLISNDQKYSPTPPQIKPLTKSESANLHYDFYISYSVKNLDVANYVVEKIEKRGYKCFIASRDLNHSADYALEITSGMNNSIAVLLIFSYNADKSVYVEREINLAISQNKLIIPLQIEKFTPSEPMIHCIGTIQWIQAINGIQDFHIDKIIKILDGAKQINSAPKVSFDSSTSKKDSSKNASYPTSFSIPKNIGRNKSMSKDNATTKSGNIQSKTNSPKKIQPVHVESPQSKPLKTAVELALERTQIDNTSARTFSVPNKDAGSTISNDQKYSPNKSESVNAHYDFYISYSSENSDVADYVVEKIEKRGYKCFIEPHNTTNDLNNLDLLEDIIKSDLYASDDAKESNRAIENSSAIILILSSDSNISSYIEIEIMLAVALKKPIIPFQIEYVILSEELESYLKNIPIIDAYPKILNTHFDAIAETFNTLKHNNYFYPITKTTTRKTTDISETAAPINSLSTYLESLRKNPLYKFDGNIYISGQSEKGDEKIRRAERNYFHLQQGETSLLCLDTTNEWLLATTKGVYVKDIKGNSRFYSYDNFPNLIIFSKSNGCNDILFGLEMNTLFGAEINNDLNAMTDFKQTFLFLDLLNRFQIDFNTNQKNSKFIDWKLLKDTIDPYMFSPIDESTILYFCYGEDSNENLNSIIEKNISISSSEKILIFGNLFNLKHSSIISHIEQSKSLPPYSFLATTKGIYVNNDSKYKNVFIGYNEIHSFTAVFQEYKDSPNRTEIFVYCSEKKYFPIKTKLVQFLCVPVVELLNKLRDNFIAKQNS